MRVFCERPRQRPKQLGAGLQFLPTLSSGSAFWRLPFVDSTVLAICQALLLDDIGERQQRCLKALAMDPSLLLWSVCRAQWVDGVALTTVPAASDWLSHRALVELRQFDEEPLEAAADFPQRSKWADLAANAVVGLPEENDCPTYLAHLLRESVDWLCSSGTRVSIEDVRAGKTCIPNWLASRMDEVSLSGVELANEPTKYANQVRQRWLCELDSVHGMLDALVAKLNRIDRLESDFSKALEHEKLESLKEFAYGAGHEINNPLANISTRAQTLLHDESDPERRRRLATINSQAFRAHEMIADLMLFARPPKPSLESIDLVDVVDQIVSELAPQAREQGTELCRTGKTESLTLWADPAHLNVALRALCTNSLEAVGHGGRIGLDVHPVEDRVQNGDGGHWAVIIVRDTGPGIDDEVRRHLFDPFFSGREAGRGLGFGLSKCWRIVSQHGGQVDVASELGNGATFTIRLPLQREPSPLVAAT